MSDVTVKQLATDVGIAVEKLVDQLAKAGIKGKKESSSITEDEKRQLLDHLRQSHGKGKEGAAEVSKAPKKITLRRRTVSSLRQSGGATPGGRGGSSRGGRNPAAKSVSVEVRGKRTYVKRSTIETDESKVAAAEVAKKALKEQEALKAKSKKQDDARKAAGENKRRDDEIRRKKDNVKREDKDSKTSTRGKREPTEREKAAQIAKDAREARLKAEAAASKDSKGRKGKPVNKHKKPDEPVRDQEGAGKGPNRKKKSKVAKRELRRGQRRSHQPQVVVDPQHAFQKPTAPVVRDVEIPDMITAGDLAMRMSIKASEVIKVLMGMGMMVTINQPLDRDTSTLVVEEMGHNAVDEVQKDLEKEVLSVAGEDEAEKFPRAPVVTIMGHVDHGKTSLLDFIRDSRVAAGEAGGITQHIGAYKVSTGHGELTFLDTPGHAAFSAMRARGANATDIVVIVVAADDGVMPQTKEAIQHSRAAGVPIIIAINKMDKEDAQPDRVMNELVAEEVVPEAWGGDVQFVQVSAKTGDGITELLDAILLESEVLELGAPTSTSGRGIVVESSLDKGRGVVATVLIQSGTMRKGDSIVSGAEYGRIRAMFDDTGKQIKEAGPSTPVQILGLSGSPNAGDDAVAVSDEKRARELAEHRREIQRDTRLAAQKAAKLEELFNSMTDGVLKNVNLVIKADVQGSVEALRDSLTKLSNDEVKVKVVASGVGGINEGDANLAAASGASIIGFNVRADASARTIIEEQGLDLRYYSIIYEIIDDVKAAISGLLSPIIKEEIIGLAEVRDVFRSSKLGAIAGCMVIEGTIKRSEPIRVLRDNIVIYEGELESLRRHKDDVQEVKSGTECGIGVKNYNDVKPGDQIEVFERIEVAREV